jgi:hypothetical protein
MAAQTNPMIRKAWGYVKEMSADEKARAYAEAYEKLRRDMASIDLEWYRAEGAARAYKEMNIPIADIAVKTGLSIEEIKEL